MSKPVITFLFQSATQWTTSAHTLHVSKPVITFVFKVLRNGLLRYMPYTHMCEPVITFVFKVLRNGPALVHTLHMPKPVITFVFFKVPPEILHLLSKLF